MRFVWFQLRCFLPYQCRVLILGQKQEHDEHIVAKSIHLLEYTIAQNGNFILRIILVELISSDNEDSHMQLIQKHELKSKFRQDLSRSMILLQFRHINRPHNTKCKRNKEHETGRKRKMEISTHGEVIGDVGELFLGFLRNP